MSVVQKDKALDQPVPVPTGTGTRIMWYAITDNGLVRPQNEDAHVVDAVAAKDDTLRHLLAVADGVGGHHGGATASRMALRAIMSEFLFWRGGAPERLVSRSVRRANDAVFDGSHAQSDLSHMQTTLTAVVIEYDTLAVGHVGDCRLYRARKGHTALLTRDHTVASELLHLRLITEEQALEHPGRHQLTRSLGSEPFLQIDVVKEKIMVGDTYLLCSDGLWSQTTPYDIEDMLQNKVPDRACKELVNLALRRGAPDNITAIVFRITRVGSRPPSRPFWRSIMARGRSG
jgi:PPM family protein phosphatase